MFTIFVDFLLGTTGMTLSCIVFEVIFYALNNSILMLFVPIQNKISKIKNKKFFKWGLYIIFIGISTGIKSSFNLNYFMLGITIGFFYSLTTMLFRENMIAE